MVEIKVRCIECEAKHQVVVGMVKKQEMKIEEIGESIWLTYFDCPSCGARNFVQVDDSYTNELLKTETDLMIKVMKQKKFGKVPHRKQSEKYKRISNDLAESRKTLMESLTGKYVIESETNERFELQFNVC